MGPDRNSEELGGCLDWPAWPAGAEAAPGVTSLVLDKGVPCSFNCRDSSATRLYGRSCGTDTSSGRSISAIRQCTTPKGRLRRGYGQRRGPRPSRRMFAAQDRRTILAVAIYPLSLSLPCYPQGFVTQTIYCFSCSLRAQLLTFAVFMSHGASALWLGQALRQVQLDVRWSRNKCSLEDDAQVAGSARTHFSYSRVKQDCYHPMWSVSKLRSAALWILAHEGLRDKLKCWNAAWQQVTSSTEPDSIAMYFSAAKPRRIPVTAAFRSKAGSTPMNCEMRRARSNYVASCKMGRLQSMSE